MKRSTAPVGRPRTSSSSTRHNWRLIALKQFLAYLNRWVILQQLGMRESLRIDSPFMGAGMPKAYSRDLRGSALSPLWRPVMRRDARQQSVSRSAWRRRVKWLQRWYQQRSAAPKPRGGERFAVGRVRGRDFGSDRPTAGPDLGRNGCRTAQATDQNQPQLALAFSRPTQHHAQKKCCKQPNGSEQMWRELAPPLDTRAKVCLIMPGWCLSTRPPSARTW